jgi:hypothetical protein
MSLDITFKECENIICPHCGEIVGTEDLQSVNSGGKCWYPVLESLGYYVPYNKRTEENDWYGKDMTLTYEQANEMYQKIKADKFDFTNGVGIMNLIAQAVMNRNQIVICADW